MYRFEKVVGILIQTGFSENPPTHRLIYGDYMHCKYNATSANPHILQCINLVSTVYNQESE
jgi:hypothetical protein